MPAQEDDRCRAFLHQCINLANIQVSRAYCIITERIYEMSLKVPVINEFLVQFTDSGSNGHDIHSHAGVC